MNLPLLTACCLITSAWGQGGHEAASGTGPDLCKDNITGVITCHFRDPRSEYKGQPGWNPEGTYDETSPYAVDPTQCKNGTCYVGYPGPCLYGFTSVENCPTSGWGFACNEHHDILCQCITQELQREKNTVDKEKKVTEGWVFFALMFIMPLVGYFFIAPIILARRRGPQLFQEQEVRRTPASSSATASSPTSQVQMVEVKSGGKPEHLNGASAQPVAQDDVEKGIRLFSIVLPFVIFSVLAIVVLVTGYTYNLDTFWNGCNARTGEVDFHQEETRGR